MPFLVLFILSLKTGDILAGKNPFEDELVSVPDAEGKLRLPARR